MIVSALNQNHTIVFIENVWIKRQISILNLNVPRSMWDYAEEPTFTIFYKIGTDSFENAFLSANRPKAVCSISGFYQCFAMTVKFCVQFNIYCDGNVFIN